MSVTSDLAKALDKAYEDKSLTEILDASPAALAGVTDADAEALQKAFTSRQFANSARTNSSRSPQPWRR